MAVISHYYSETTALRPARSANAHTAEFFNLQKKLFPVIVLDVVAPQQGWEQAGGATTRVVLIRQMYGNTGVSLCSPSSFILHFDLAPLFFLVPINENQLFEANADLFVFYHIWFYFPLVQL